jgi:hypothetical protein
MEIDWSKAPEGAEFYAFGAFRKMAGSKNGMPMRCSNSGNDVWYLGDVYSLPECQADEYYQQRPKEWPTDERISAIARNGGDGLHYDEQLDEPVPFQVWSKEFAKPPKTSAEYLSECLRVQTERGKQYDASGTGERSFKAAADAFNAATGKSLTGSDVCLLLAMVKLVRQYSSPDRLHQDSLLDGVSYMSLWAEMLTNELGA